MFLTITDADFEIIKNLTLNKGDLIMFLQRSAGLFMGYCAAGLPTKQNPELI